MTTNPPQVPTSALAPAVRERVYLAERIAQLAEPEQLAAHQRSILAALLPYSLGDRNRWLIAQRVTEWPQGIGEMKDYPWLEVFMHFDWEATPEGYEAWERAVSEWDAGNWKYEIPGAVDAACAARSPA